MVVIMDMGYETLRVDRPFSFLPTICHQQLKAFYLAKYVAIYLVWWKQNNMLGRCWPSIKNVLMLQ